MNLHLEIKKIFNKNDYSIDFDNKLNVLIGENGCGKSTIINIIYNLAIKNFQYLSNLPFDSISLSLDSNEIKINYDDLKQLEISTNPAFRSKLFEIDLSKYSSFDDFLNCVLNMKLATYHYKTNEYDNNKDYLKEDIYFSSQEYVNFMSKYNVVYGSKLYLLCYYSFYKKQNPFEILEKIVSKVRIYSFVNIEETDNLKIDLNEEKEKLCISYLEKYFIDKEVFFNNKELFIRDTDTLDIIEERYLSSGERKIIKIIELLTIVEENDILLLDEPELSLSIYWQRYLIEDILKYCKAKKVIMASQSPNLLNVSELDYLIPIYSDESALDE